MNISKITGFENKDSLALHSLRWKFFNSRRLKHDKLIYTYTEKYMGHLLRQSIKSGNVGVFYRIYKSENPKTMFKVFQKS